MTEASRFEFIKPQLTRPSEVGARVVFKEWLTPETLKIAFEPTQRALFPFVAGQYVSLVLEADEPRGLRRALRPYSLWAHPDEFEYAVTIVRMIEGGRATSWLRDIDVGAELKMVGPLGSFFLRRPLHRRLVFVATGNWCCTEPAHNHTKKFSIHSTTHNVTKNCTTTTYQCANYNQQIITQHKTSCRCCPS